MHVLKSFSDGMAFQIRRGAYGTSAMVRESWYRLVRLPADEILWWLWDRGYTSSSRSLSRRNVVAHLQRETLLQVAPRHIEFFVGFDTRRSKRRFLWPGDWEEHAQPIRNHQRYRLMHDALHFRDRVRQSPTFERLLGQLHAGRPRAIVNKGLLLDSPERIEAFLEQQVLLLDSIAEQGLRLDLAPDEINVAVGRNGDLYKVNAGRKRTMAAKLLGIAAMPVRITQMHPLWLERFHGPDSERQARALVRALAAVRDRHRWDE